MFSYLKNKFFKRKQKPAEPHVPFDQLTDKQKLVLEFQALTKKQGGCMHKELVTIAAVWFNVDMRPLYYRLKEHNKYGQWFQIKSVNIEYGKTLGEVNDVIIVLYDAAYGTSESSNFFITLSIKVFDEWMEPVDMSLMRAIRAKHT